MLSEKIAPLRFQYPPQSWHFSISSNSRGQFGEHEKSGGEGGELEEGNMGLSGSAYK